MKKLLERVAGTIADYRNGELATPDADHVGRWISQFDTAVREPLLAEVAHVLDNTYFSRMECEKFMNGLAEATNLAGNDPGAFWRGVHFLQIQNGGQSQADMLALFASTLKKKFAIAALPSGASNTFIYLDDISFSGNRVLNDLRPWIANTAPKAGNVNIIVMALHSGGQYYANKALTEAAGAAGKALEFEWWYAAELEDRRGSTDSSDVLRPIAAPKDACVEAHVANMQHKPVWRTPGQIGGRKFFSSDSGRQLLEQEFLKAGCRIRQICPNLPLQHRPLGFSKLETLGFGTMMVTYRNCPNNAPLALWVSNPWFPLFPRKNN